MKYSESVTDKVRLWVIIKPDYLYFGNGVKCLPKLNGQIVKYILSKKYRDLIRELNKTREKVEGDLINPMGIIVHPLEVRCE